MTDGRSSATQAFLARLTGARSRLFEAKQLKAWIGKRAQAGRVTPAGFPRSGRLS